MLKAMFPSLSKIFPKQRDVQGSDNSYLSKSDWKDVDIYYEANKIIYNENADTLNISDFLRNGRLRYANYKLSDLNSLYFSSITNIEGNSPQSLDKVLPLIDENLLLIEPLIMYELKAWGKFHIKSIPTIEIGLLCFSLLMDCKKCQDLKETIEFFPDLKFYLQEAEESVIFCKIIPTLLTFIKDKGGVKANDLKDEFPENFELIKSRMYYLAKFGIVNKTKIGRYNYYEIS